MKLGRKEFKFGGAKWFNLIRCVLIWVLVFRFWCVELKSSGSISSFEFSSYSGGVEFRERNSTLGGAKGFTLVWCVLSVNMGASFSSCVCDGDATPSRPRLGDIPESCVALVLMYLDPPDICKLARLNRAFRDASMADFIWESKLPSNYKFIVEKALKDASVEELGKRDIYARLCRPNSFDNGTKVSS